MRPPQPSKLVVLPLCLSLAALGGCEDEQKQQAREVAERAADKTGEVAEQAAEKTGEAARKAGAGVQAGVDKAREGLADARERYEVDDKLGDAKQQLGVALDETAEGFAELAESGKEQSAKVVERLDGARLELGAEDVRCDDAPTAAGARRCEVDPKLVAQLRERPMLLATEALLKPKRGETGGGLQLGRINADGFCDVLGLQKDDILLELNGVTLDSFDAIRQLDEALAGKDTATLVYERAGERETLEIQQQVLAPEPG